MILFSLLTVFLTGFLILELQVSHQIEFRIHFIKPILFQRWVDSLIKEHKYIQFLSYIPKILLAIIIPIFDDLYHKVAVWLNDMGEFDNHLWHVQYTSELLMSNVSENYRSDESFEEHFVLKLILVSTLCHPTFISQFKRKLELSSHKHWITLHNGFTFTCIKLDMLYIIFNFFSCTCLPIEIFWYFVFSFSPRKLQSWGWLWKQFHLQNLSCKYY